MDVSLAVVGGGVAGAWDLLAPAVDATLLTDPPVSGAPLRIVPGTLRGDAVVLGAAALVAASDRSVLSEPFSEGELLRDVAS